MKPITPKPNVATILYIAAATVLFKTCCSFVLTVVSYWTISKTLITGPDYTITKVSITCDL
jgi:hypothetical protein